MNTHRENTLTFVVKEHAGQARFKEPVTFGIPFPKGMVADWRSLTLWDASGQQQSLQIKALSQWADKSYKWLLFDLQADVKANSEAKYQLRFDATESAVLQSAIVTFEDARDNFIVQTGKASFFLDREVFKPFNRVVAGQADLLMSQGSSFVLTDEEGQPYLPRIEDLLAETEGPLRLTIKARGEMQSVSRKSLARFVARLSFFAGSDVVELQITLHNPRAARHPGGLWDLGDEGSIYFKNVSLHIPMQIQPISNYKWKTQGSQAAKESIGTGIEIYQDSSGGANWRSSNHVNRFGQVTHSFRGYRVMSAGALLEEGVRATPVLAIEGANGSVAGTIDKFWQNFPKAIEAQGNELVIRLFPRQFNDVFELQGGEQKTHTIYLQFGVPGEQTPDLNWVHERLVPRATPEWYADSKAVSYLSPLTEDRNSKCKELIETAIAGEQSFFARREIIDEYGWRHFGDIYADHEAVGHIGETPLVAHYNNQYDVIHGAVVQFLRGGDERWFELATDLARHVIDIDMYHTQEDRSGYNGGLFWHTDHYLDAGTASHRAYSKQSLNVRSASSYGGGPANEHNYTTGLLEYYYCAGDETAREGVLSLADWVVEMDDGSSRFLGWLDKRPTGLSSASASRDYHGPGRGGGNSINALIDAYSLTRETRYLKKAEELIRRCIHPSDDFHALDLENIEHHWSYLVFLQALCKYLDCKVENSDNDFMYDYAQASLSHYARWMLEHEVPYATVLHKVEIPSETWPAQDIRKCVVFHMAAKYDGGFQSKCYRDKARLFFDACINDLRAIFYMYARKTNCITASVLIRACILSNP